MQISESLHSRVRLAAAKAKVSIQTFVEAALRAALKEGGK